MLGKTFAKLHEMFETMTEEVEEVLANATTGKIKVDEISVEIHDGNVMITGPLKELTINGKLVRFPKGEP